LHFVGTADWNGWGNGAGNNRFQSAAAAGLTEASVARLKLKWAFGYPGGTSAYGQPTVVAGRVFVGTDIGYVYSLDAASGCVYWSYRAGAGVRNAMTVGPIKSEGGIRYAVFFGDLKASAYAIDAQNGSEIWKTHVEDHYAARVTAAPALYQGRLYVPISAWEGFQARVPDYPCCTAVGSVSALAASTGKRIWKTYTIAERPHPTEQNSRGVQQWAPAGAPIWNTPTIDARRRVVYVGTGMSTYPATRRAMHNWLWTRRPGSCAGHSRSTNTIRSSSAAAGPGSPRTVRRWWGPTGISRCHRCSRASRTGKRWSSSAPSPVRFWR
jgi:polyvinyl alcohol dehydrogenase (cytochrome)